MRLFYSVRATGAILQVTQMGVTAPVYSPHIEGLIYANEESQIEGKPASLLLGTIAYPTASGQLLPPVLLIEPLEDPDTAERRYCVTGEYRYIGQFLLPDHRLGEVAEVGISREALALWQALAQRSDLHARTEEKRREEIAKLFLLPRQSMNLPSLPAHVSDQVLLDTSFRELQHADEQCRRDALVRLKSLDPASLPISPLFPCLNDSSETVRDLALSLLMPLSGRISEGLLTRIVYHGPIHASLAAISLLVARGGERVESLLLATRWRKHAWIRMASLRGLVALDGHRLDLVAALTTALNDSVSDVRVCAAQLMETLADIQFIPVLQEAMRVEIDASVRFVAVRSLSSLERQIVGYKVVQASVRADGEEGGVSFHISCFSRLRQDSHHEVTREITYAAATTAGYRCDSCGGPLSSPPLRVRELSKRIHLPRVVGASFPPNRFGQEEDMHITATVTPVGSTGVAFNALLWFQEAATDRDILDLRSNDYAGTAADEVVQFIRAFEDNVGEVLASCETTGTNYSCRIVPQEAEAWITRHRHHLRTPIASSNRKVAIS